MCRLSNIVDEGRNNESIDRKKHMQEKMEEEARMILERKLPNISLGVKVETETGYGSLDGKVEEGTAVETGQITIKLLVEDKILLKIIQTTGLEAHLSRAYRDISSKNGDRGESGLENDKITHIITARVHPRLLGGSPEPESDPGSEEINGTNPRKRRRRQSSIQEYFQLSRPNQQQSQHAQTLATSTQQGSSTTTSQRTNSQQPGSQQTVTQAVEEMEKTRQEIDKEIESLVIDSKATGTKIRTFAKRNPGVVYNIKISPEIEEIFEAITYILAWRKSNKTVLELIWTALKEISNNKSKEFRILWIKQRGNQLIPCVNTKRVAGVDKYKIVQAVVKKTPRKSSPESCIQRGTNTPEVEVGKTPRTHAFLIQTAGGYKIINGKIDISPKDCELKENFQAAENKLAMAILNLTKSTGQSTITKRVQQLVTTSPTTQSQHIQIQSQSNTTTQTLTETAWISNELNDVRTDIDNGDTSQSTDNEQPQQQSQTAAAQSNLTENTMDEQRDNNNDTVETNNQTPQDIIDTSMIRPDFRELVTDIMNQTPEHVVERFNKKIGDFQESMMNEVRKDALKVETTKFVPPVGFVPKGLSRSQFKKISDALVQNDTDVRGKQFKFLNLMNLIQTKFREPNQRGTTEVKEIVHRKMCDGNLGAAFRIAKGEMQKEKIETTQEDIDTLFPMNQNKKWNDMKYPRAERSITDERINSLIAKLPRERAPGRSRITYGHIKRLNANERTTKQIHELIRHTYANPDKVPQDYYTAQIRMLPKPNKGKRPIALQESIVKIIHKHIAGTITNFAMSNKQFSNTQFCIGCPEGTAEAAARIYLKMCKEEPCFAAALDLTNAFNTIDQQSIITGLEQLDVPDGTREYIYHYLRAYTICYECNGHELKRRTLRGVPQGCPAAMAMFAVGLFQTLKEIIDKKQVRLICYADDIVILGNSIEVTEAAIKEVQNRLELSQLKVNPDKTKRITNGPTMDNYISWDEAEWKHLGIPISKNPKFIESCLDKIKQDQLDAMDAVWGNNVASHHESYLIQRICIQPMAQYALRAIMPEISEDYLLDWDQQIQEKYPKYIQNIPKHYRAQQVSNGGLQLIPPRIIREAASTAFKASNEYEHLDEWMRKRIEATVGKEEEQKLQEIVTHYLQWYSMRYIQMAEEEQMNNENRRDRYEQPEKLIGNGNNKLIEGRPTVMTPEDSAWLARVPRKPNDLLDTLGFKIALTLRYNLKWEEDEELNKLFCAKNHKKASTSDGTKGKGDRLSLSHILTCRTNSEGKLTTRHDTIVRIIGRRLAAKGKNPHIEQPLYYGDQRRECPHRPDVWYHEDDHIHLYDVTVCGFKDAKNKESWSRARRQKQKQYEQITNALKDNITLNIVQFDAAARMGPETAAIMDGIGVKRYMLVDIQLMILSLNSWLYKNAINKAIAARKDGRGWESLQWAEMVLAEC